MNLTRGAGCLALLAAGFVPAAGADEPPAATAAATAAPSAKDPAREAPDNNFLRKWRKLRDALEDFTTYDFKDGMFQIRVSGRLQIDATVAGESQRLEDSVGGLDDSVKFRSAELRVHGRFLRHWEYRLDAEFATDAGIKQAYIEGGHLLRYVRVRMGNFTEPFSLERVGSSYDTPFLERSLPVATFAPGQSIGIQFHNHHLGGRLAWAAGAFTVGATTDENQSNSDLNFTMRLSGTPFFQKDGRRLVHLGISYSARSAADSKVTYQSRPEARFLPHFIGTGEIDATGMQLLGGEAAAVVGPAWFQGEVVASSVNARDGSDPAFTGWYVEGGYTFTGESRIYQTRNGTFGRLIPANPYRGGNLFRQGAARGAFGISARLSGVDLSDGPVQGGKMKDLNIGLDWQLNRANRVLLNYIHSKVEDGGSANIFLLRYQFYP